MLDSPMPGPRSRLAARASAAPVVPAGLRAMDLVAASAVLHRPQPPRARLDRLRLHVAVPDGPDLGARGPAGGRGCRTRKSSCKPQGAIDLTTRLQAGMVELGSVRSCFMAGIDDAAPVHRRRGCGGRGQAAIRPPAGRPRSVRAWLDAAGPSQLHIASITVSELYLGLALARPLTASPLAKKIRAGGDLLDAATAAQHQAVVVTGNLADFAAVAPHCAGLRALNPSTGTAIP